MSRDSWLFLFAAITAFGVIATFFRVDAMVIYQWWRRGAEQRNTTPYSTREKVMAVLAALSFISSAAGFYFSERVAPQIVLQWGPAGRSMFVLGDPQSYQGPRASLFLVDGSKLGDWANKNYKLIGICFHHLRSGDVLDEQNISKSGLYDIEPREMQIEISWNAKFVDELTYGVSPTGYELLAVPLGVTPDSFDTIRQAVALGAVRLDRKGGPP